jgi:hypothetical protein
MVTGERNLHHDFVAGVALPGVPEALSPLKSSAQRSEHVTDLYLAELAASREMKLGTLDAGISHRAVELIV